MRRKEGGRRRGLWRSRGGVLCRIFASLIWATHVGVSSAGHACFRSCRCLFLCVVLLAPGVCALGEEGRGEGGRGGGEWHWANLQRIDVWKSNNFMRRRSTTDYRVREVRRVVWPLAVVVAFTAV